jgi:WD40 repeat protein/Tfp pilus assembly protein PilF
MGSSAAEVEQALQASRLYLAKGEMEEAVERASEAIRLDAKQSAAYLVRAEAHRRLKRPERALADLAVAIRLDPSQPGPYVIRAEILKRRNMFDSAIADVTHALTLDPRNAGAFSVRAECRGAIGDVDGANDDVQEMLLIDPTRSVPDLSARSASGDPTPATASDDERFWKQSGTKSRDLDPSIFADGKPVDKSYRSRRVVSDDDAPEVLGVASGYKPETIGRPIPRIKAANQRSNLPWLMIGIGIAGAGVVGFLAANRRPIASHPIHTDSLDQTTASQPTNRQSPNPITFGQTIGTTPPESVPMALTTPRTETPTSAPPSPSPNRAMNDPPNGFTALFNGEDLTNWREAIPGHWHVRDGVIHHDGGGGNLITTTEYGNFELLVDWKIDPGGDSGIYLRGKPQVQIWDDPVGSGGLFNNKRHPSKPLVRADNPVGEWNTLRILISGSFVTVYLNGQLVVNQVELESYPDYRGPIPKRGSIEIQHFRSHLQFRNIFVRGLSFDDQTTSSSAPPTTIDVPRMAILNVPSLEGTRKLEGHTAHVLGLAFSRDGRWLASASGSGDSTVRLWNVAGNQGDSTHITLGTTGSPPPKAFVSVVFSPDGTLLAASNMDGRIFLWDVTVTPPRLLRTLSKHDDSVVAIAFSQNGKLLATGERNKGQVCVWDLSDPSIPLKTSISSEKNGVWSLAFSPDGKTLFEGVSLPSLGSDLPNDNINNPGQIWIWDIGTRPYVKKSINRDVRKRPRSIAFSPNGSQFAYGDGDVVKVVDLRTGRQVSSFEKHTSWVISIAYTPDGKHLLSGSYDKTARLWDAETGEQVLEYGDATGAIEAVAISPDGRLAAIGGYEKAIRLLRLRPLSNRKPEPLIAEPPRVPDNRIAELAELTELNPPEPSTYPSLTKDGLTIFYECKNAEVWTAKRKDADSVFQGKERLFVGRHPSVSADGLQLVFLAARTDGQPGSSIHIATRDSLNDQFRRPKEIRELRDQDDPKSPWLSGDALTILFSHRRADGNGPEVMVCSRSSPASSWSMPKALPLLPGDVAPTWASLSDDGLSLYCCFGGSGGANDRRPNLTIWSRGTKDDPFSNPTLIELGGLPPLVGRCPRYIPATNELYFSSGKISVVRNFKPTVGSHMNLDSKGR